MLKFIENTGLPVILKTLTGYRTYSQSVNLYNISIILEWKDISRTVYEVVLSLQMTKQSLERVTNGLKLSNNASKEIFN